MGWLRWFDATDFEFARQVLQRGVAAIFLVAFWSSLNQFRVLCGEHGLLPAPRILASSWRLRGPTLFRWRFTRYSDRRLVVLCWCGMGLAASVVVGLPQLGPPWAPMLVFLALWFGYLSIVDVGQTFYGFGWEMLLCEAGFTVAFLGSDEVPPPLPIIVLCWWLVFRLEFGAGMIKIRGDSAWRDLTALYYHHETQPMPGPLSRQAHLLPRWMHRGEVLGNHFAQLVAPWFLFAPQPVGAVAGVIVILTQGWLVVTGNFAWLNWITIVLAGSALGDAAVHAVIPAVPVAAAAPSHPSPVWWIVLVCLVTAGMLVLAWRPLRNLFSRGQLMNASFNRWQLQNAYGVRLDDAGAHRDGRRGHPRRGAVG